MLIDSCELGLLRIKGHQALAWIVTFQINSFTTLTSVKTLSLVQWLSRDDTKVHPIIGLLPLHKCFFWQSCLVDRLQTLLSGVIHIENLGNPLHRRQMLRLLRLEQIWIQLYDNFLCIWRQFDWGKCFLNFVCIQERVDFVRPQVSFVAHDFGAFDGLVFSSYW